MNNADTHPYGSYYEKTYTINENQTGRTIYQFDTTVIKWDEFKLWEFYQMAWIVMSSTIRFVSFSDDYDPRLADNWRYLNIQMELIDASKFFLA